MKYILTLSVLLFFQGISPLTAQNEDLALGKPVKVTSTGFFRTPAPHIVDGNPETAWRASGSDPLPYYVQIDLQGNYDLNHLKLVEALRGGAFRLTSYSVFLSKDGVIWDRVHRGTTIGQGVEIEVDSEATRFIRLWIEDDDGLNLPMIAQISAFGSRSDTSVQRQEEDSLSSESRFIDFSFLENDSRGQIVTPDWPERSLQELEDGRFRFSENFKKSIHFIVPAGSDLSRLTPVFTYQGRSVLSGDAVVASGNQPMDFTDAVPLRILADDDSESVYVVFVHESPGRANIQIANEEVGQAMDFVGYSAMNLTDGDNLYQWYRYSNIGSIRYWLSPFRQVSFGNISRDCVIEDLSTFEKTRDSLRETMLDSPYDDTWINWQGVAERHRQVIQNGLRHTSHYAMQRMKDSGIEVMAELNDSNWAPPFESEVEKWQRAWQLWQMFYAQTFYLASRFDIQKFQGPNEPESQLGRFSSSPEERAAAVERFVFMNSVYADAVRAAIDDVNTLYGKSLDPIWGSPTLASSPTQDVSIETIRNNRSDFAGRDIDFNLTNLFIMQSYSGNPERFLRSIASAREVMKEHHPEGEILPIAYTEFNYMPGAVWRQNAFTSDHSRAYLGMARVWAESMASGLFAKYQFRFSRPLDFAGNHVHHQFATPQDPARNLLYGVPYRVSSEDPDYPLSNVLLNSSSSHFAWKTAQGAEPPHKVTWEFPEPKEIRRFFINLGTQDEGMISGRLQYLDVDTKEWVTFRDADVSKGSTTHYGAVARKLPGINSRTPIANTPTVRVDRAFPEAIKANAIRFVSEDAGPILVRRIHVTDIATDGDIGGPMRSAEVTRLFAEAFQYQRPLLKSITEVAHDPDFKAYTVKDERRNRHVIWLPQTSNFVDYEVDFDFSSITNSPNPWIKIREVSNRHFGEVIYRGNLENPASFVKTQPKDSVWVVSLHHNVNTKPKEVFPVDAAQVGLGRYAESVLEFEESFIIRQHTESLDYNRIVYLKFDLSNISQDAIESALLSLNGSWETDDDPSLLPPDESFNLHVYGIANQNWSGNTLTASTAPNLGRADSLITGDGAQPLGVMSFTVNSSNSMSAISEWIKEHAGQEITLAIVRERRHENEINDTDFIRLHSSSGPVELRPRLELWLTQ